MAGGGYFDHEPTLESVDLLDASNAGGTLFGIIPFNSVLPSTLSGIGRIPMDGTVSPTNWTSTLGRPRSAKIAKNLRETVFGLFATDRPALSTLPVCRT